MSLTVDTQKMEMTGKDVNATLSSLQKDLFSGIKIDMPYRNYNMDGKAPATRTEITLTDSDHHCVIPYENGQPMLTLGYDKLTAMGERSDHILARPADSTATLLTEAEGRINNNILLSNAFPRPIQMKMGFYSSPIAVFRKFEDDEVSYTVKDFRRHVPHRVWIQPTA